MTKKKTEEMVEIKIGMLVKITKPVSGNDANEQSLGLVSDVIHKIGMSEPLWGLEIRDSDGLHWYWKREFTLIAELGLLEEIDEDIENMVKNAIDAHISDLVMVIVDDLQDRHPGISTFTRLKQHGMETVDSVLQNFIIQMLDRL